MPFVRLAHRRLIVNPGSVGMPYGRGGAHWATLAASGYPDIEPWLDFFVRQTAGDDEALAVFGPRDGRPTPPIGRRSAATA